MNEKQLKKRRNFYPNNFLDKLLLELIEAEKRLKIVRVDEKEFSKYLRERDLDIIDRIVESRVEKFKVAYIAGLLTF